RPSPLAFYSLSLHDALPISAGVLTDAQVVYRGREVACSPGSPGRCQMGWWAPKPDVQGTFEILVGAGEIVARSGGLAKAIFPVRDRKSTRLNSSHLVISYAV